MKMFRPIEARKEDMPFYTKLTEVQFAQSGLLTYLQKMDLQLSLKQKTPPQPSVHCQNPWGSVVDMEDVPNPEGKDVTAFAQTVTLKGDERDPNAEQWVNLGDDTDFETLNGVIAYDTSVKTTGRTGRRRLVSSVIGFISVLRPTRPTTI